MGMLSGTGTLGSSIQSKNANPGPDASHTMKHSAAAIPAMREIAFIPPFAAKIAITANPRARKINVTFHLLSLSSVVSDREADDESYKPTDCQCEAEGLKQRVIHVPVTSQAM